MTNLSFTDLFCQSSFSHFYMWLFPESSHRPANTLCCSPRNEVFSHSIPSLLFIVFSFPHHVNLLTLELSLSLALHLCHLSISLRLPLCTTYVSPSQSCYQPLFYFQTSFYSKPPAPISLCPSPAFPHLASSYIWERTKKAEKIKKQACDGSTGAQDSGWPGTFPFLFPPLLFSSFYQPFFFFSLLYDGLSFPHTILFPFNSPPPALSIYHFHVTSSKGGSGRHSAPARIGCWEGELGKVASVARASETCASKVPLARQMSVADTERVALCESRWVKVS